MVEHRQPKPTVDFIDEYCQYYRKLFSDVRGFEAFKFLHMGMISDIKRKTLPAISFICRIRESSTITPFFNSFALGYKSTKRAKIKINFRHTIWWPNNFNY